MAEQALTVLVIIGAGAGTLIAFLSILIGRRR